MSYNRFSGDIAVKLTENGAIMKFVNGEPVRDQGFDNAVQISLYTKNGYWGNVLETEESKKIGSDFEEVSLKPITSLSTINDNTDSITRALKWMRDTKIAKSISVTVINPRVDYVRASIIIYPPGKDAQELLFLKNGQNWINQANNPASERF